MTSRRQFIRTTALTTGSLVGGGMVASTTSAAPEREPLEAHPHIHKAIHELREARHELKETPHDFRGHRDEAIESIDRAIRQLEICLKEDRR